ncbi:MAG: prepilin-type N-terminal cleavage/methylation domain-containing protein [Desulfobulbaceae bacterium]|nr:prepilin-type N-terminal cleavage/methylation domain-containing protein [Desulfobulbaceae bacterium]
MKSRKSLFIGNCRGFTLVELMITLAMSAIIVAAVYSAYIIQQKTYYTQGQVVEMQQNIRAGLEMMSSEIRMAVYDPDGNAGAQVITATASTFAFTADLNDDGDVADPNENVTFCLGTAGVCDADGVANAGTASVLRNSQAIADGIQRIEFCYTLDGANNCDSVVSAGNISKISNVRITMLAVASQRDSKYTNTQSYTAGSGTIWPANNDNFRRRLLTYSVNIRNHGLVK